MRTDFWRPLSVTLICASLLAQQQAPQSVEKGQTIEQVVALWGQPQKIVNLDTKTIYYYPDAKITFLNGKVSDVQ